MCVGLGVKMQEGDNKKARKMNFPKKTCILKSSARKEAGMKVFPPAAMLQKQGRLHVVRSPCGVRNWRKNERVGRVLFEKRL